jgi:Uma2 family endonuclease
MTWQDVLERNELQELPFKIELNARGKLELTPRTNTHGLLQMLIGSLLGQQLTGGACISECSVLTTQGVKVADVAWVSKAFLEQYAQVTPFPVSPEICVEIVSPSNSTAEIIEKIGLYSAKGAREVWTCNLQGAMRFYDAEGALVRSKLVPEFPVSIEW